MRLLFLAFLLIAGNIQAADLESVLKAARAHHESKLAKIDDMVLQYTGTFTSPGGEGAGMTSTLTRKGEKWRMDATMSTSGSNTTVNGKPMPGGAQNLETVVLFDGKDVWTSTMGMKIKLPKDKAMEQLSFTEYWKEPPAGSTVLGEETVYGRACYVVEYPKNEFVTEPVKLWIDKEHFVSIQSVTAASGKTMRTAFSDLKAIDGDYVIPHKAEVFSDGTKTMDVVVTKVEVNKGVADGLFDASQLQGSAMDMDLEKMMKQAEEMQKKYGK
jgi:outer membrane lipoprotein-sorting protein